MAETTIQWADYTFNPWVGCQRVSPGCEHCYAETYDKRVGGGVDTLDGVKKLRWGPKAPRIRTSAANWRQPMKWNREAAKASAETEYVTASGQRVTPHRPRVFCSSLADVFEDRPELVPWREDLFGLIASTPNLDWLLLTKRPENIARLWPEFVREPGGDGVLPCWPPGRAMVGTPREHEPWPNVWLGTTVEDQQRARERIPHLLSVPAAVRFLSCEPLLEQIDLTPWLFPDGRPVVDWVIIGGESGAGARRFDVAWALRLVKQCKAAGVRAAPFVKQLGANVIDRNDAGFEAENDVVNDDRFPELHGVPTNPRAWPTPKRIEENIDGYRDEYQGAPVRVHLNDRAGGDMSEWPLALRVREFPEVHRG